ncbi:MAG TPA: glycosyl transferase family 2 [Nitrospira sp.]|nr:glycosyl transferase family 2 [Nitrospira sp.]
MIATQDGADAPWQQIRRQLPQVERADILVGLPSFNNAETVKPVIQAVTTGLRQAFPAASVLLVNQDAGSQDGTPELMKGAVEERFPIALLNRTASGTSGMESFPRLSGASAAAWEEAFQAFLSATKEAGATACAVIDSGARSVTPDWIAWLLGPIMESRADYVAPLFLRPRYEGSLTNTLVFPLNRSLYGTAMRYHTGGGCGISGTLAGVYLKEPFWNERIARTSLETCLATVAIAEGRSLCQAGLGEKLVQSPAGGQDLSTVVAQTVGAAFYFMERYQDVWEHSPPAQPVLHTGIPYRPQPDRGPINIDMMMRGFRQGLRDLLPIWEIILSPETLAGILPLGLIEKDDFRFPPELWAQTVYDFALAYHDNVLHREHLLKSLTPLYLGQMASLVLRTQHQKPEDVEDCIEELCHTFARTKAYLVERWRFS